MVTHHYQVDKTIDSLYFDLVFGRMRICPPAYFHEKGMRKQFEPPESLSHCHFDELRNKYHGVLFHGTGRFARTYEDRDKSETKNEVTDVLRSVLTTGLLPQEDIVAKALLQITQTVSMTRHRLYARCYAQLFGADDQQSDHLSYKFGDREDWWSYYIKSTARGVMTLKNLGWLPRMLWNRYTRFTLRERLSLFTIKQREMKRWLSNKIDVTGNYPLIFGVEESVVHPLDLPHGVRDYEVRTSDPIAPNAIKLIEAPESDMATTRQLLIELGLSHIETIPMEHGETFCWQQGWGKAVEPIDL